MRKFNAISPRLWTSRRFQSLTSDDAKLLHLFLLTGPSQNLIGVFRLTQGEATDTLGWTAERFQKALAGLVASGMVAHDPDTREIMIHRAVKHAIFTSKCRVGAKRILEEQVESETLREAAYNELEAAWAARASLCRCRRPIHASGVKSASSLPFNA